jgi:PAS domain S-box-containing protein
MDTRTATTPTPAGPPPAALPAELSRVLFEAAGEGVVIMDAITTRILDANPVACRIHGYAPGEMIGLHVADILPNPPDFDAVSRIQRALSETGSYESDQDVHRRKDGSLFPCGINLRQVAVQGKPYKVAIYRDLTQQRRLGEAVRNARQELERTVEERTRQLAEEIQVRRTSESALRQSESRLAMLLTQLPAVLWTTDLELRFTSMKGRGLQELTIREDMVLGRTITEVMGSGEMERRAVEHHRIALRGGSSSYVLLVKDRYFNSHIEPLRDARGEIIGAIGVSLDDTERLKAEEAVRASEGRYRAVFERAPIGIGIARQGVVRYVNPAWLRMFGYPSAEEVVGTQVEDHLSPDSRKLASERARRRAAGEDIAPGVDLVGKRKDGSTFDYHVESCGLETPEGESLVVLGTDVSDRRRADAERREAHRELERKVAQRTRDLASAAEETRIAYDTLKAAQAQLIRSEKLASIGMLVSGVAHEINNPLNVIKGNLKLLTEKSRLDLISAAKDGGSSADYEKIRRMLRDATRSAERACTIIENFRSFSRDTRSAEPVDVNECLKETVQVISRQLPARVSLRTTFGKIPMVHCFRGQMNQVFFNLVKNAVEAVDGKGSVRIRTARQKGRLAVEVADTGKGIDPEFEQRIFDPFFTTKPVGKGLGLGLSISAMIVHNHAGEISFKSRPGKGTTFRVTLPLAPKPSSR